MITPEIFSFLSPLRAGAYNPSCLQKKSVIGREREREREREVLTYPQNNTTVGRSLEAI
jgi:hypothetical protein